MFIDRFADRLQGQEEETGLFPAVLPSWTVRYTGLDPVGDTQVAITLTP